MVEDCQSLVDVAVDLGELPRGVAVAEVGTPAAQHAVEVGHHPGDGVTHQASAGRFPDPGPELRHGAVRRPALQIVAAPPPPCLYLVQVEAEEVDSLAATGEADDPVLFGIWPRPHTRQDLAHPPEGLLSPSPAGAQHDEVVG